jgi:hypothetical protein
MVQMDSGYSGYRATSIELGHRFRVDFASAPDAEVIVLTPLGCSVPQNDQHRGERAVRSSCP